MQQGYGNRRRGAALAQAQVMTGPSMPMGLVLLTALGILGLGAGLAHGQPVPEVIKPQSSSPTLPPTGPDATVPVRPRSENPLADSSGARPIPDTGVIAPPSSTGTTPVIRPPAVGTMPVIPPPGSTGGDRTVVPK